jgi:hypothetical protein
MLFQAIAMSICVKRKLLCSSASRKRLRGFISTFCSVGAGLELSNNSRSLFCVVLPDASAPGAYRYQVFGQAGLYDINQCNSLGEALVCAVEEGFTDYDPGVMAALFGNQEWRKGMQVSEIYIAA